MQQGNLIRKNGWQLMRMLALAHNAAKEGCDVTVKPCCDVCS